MLKYNTGEYDLKRLMAVTTSLIIFARDRILFFMAKGEIIHSSRSKEWSRPARPGILDAQGIILLSALGISSDILEQRWQRYLTKWLKERPKPAWEKDELSSGEKLKLRIEVQQSRRLLGVADPSGTLPEGACFM